MQAVARKVNDENKLLKAENQRLEEDNMKLRGMLSSLGVPDPDIEHRISPSRMMSPTTALSARQDLDETVFVGAAGRTLENMLLPNNSGTLESLSTVSSVPSAGGAPMEVPVAATSTSFGDFNPGSSQAPGIIPTHTTAPGGAEFYGMEAYNSYPIIPQQQSPWQNHEGIP
jgi:hypothetical protein